MTFEENKMKIKREQTYVALKGEGVGVLDVLILEVVEVDLGEVGVNGHGVVVAAAGEPVVVHRGCGAVKWIVINN